MILITNDKHLLGEKRDDFGTVCKDCERRDQFGKNAYRQAYFYRIPDAKPETITRWTNGGGSKEATVYPTACYDYCYYHCKVRGLLPYQQKGGKIGKAS